MTNHKHLASLLLALAWAAPATAQQHSASEHGSHATPAIAQSGQMVDGELRKVDTVGKRVTIQHGEIKNLGMPPMTMVFQVRNPALLTAAKAGDKVRFRAESDAGALVLVALEVVK